MDHENNPKTHEMQERQCIRERTLHMTDITQAMHGAIFNIHSTGRETNEWGRCTTQRFLPRLPTFNGASEDSPVSLDRSQESRRCHRSTQLKVPMGTGTCKETGEMGNMTSVNRCTLSEGEERHSQTWVGNQSSRYCETRMKNKN